MSTRETLYVLVPCLDEETIIASTVADIAATVPSLPVDVRIVMIDDGSTDSTRSRMEALCEQHASCSMITNDSNLGIGSSVVRAYATIPDGSWVTVIPGDNEFVFASISNFLEVRDRYDVILGYLQNAVIRTMRRRLASFVFTKTVSMLYGFSWRYLNGMKMYRIEAFRGIDVVSSGHAFIPELLAKAQLRSPELRVGEVPFAARGRARGKSKALRLRSVTRSVLEVWKASRSVARYRSAITRGGPA